MTTNHKKPARVSEPAYTKADDLLHTIGGVEHPDAASGESREDRMVTIERDESGKATVWCDPEIVDLVSALNAGGIRTVASCSGHGHRPGSIALKDGRWLTISPDDETYRRIEALFPVDINGDTWDAASGEGDGFNGDNTRLCQCIDALVRMSDRGVLVPHGIGGHARGLLVAAASRIRRLTTTGQRYTQADINAEYTRGRCDGWEAAKAGQGDVERIVTRHLPEIAAACAGSGNPHAFTGFDVGPFFVHHAVSDDCTASMAREGADYDTWHVTHRASGFAVQQGIPSHARALWLARKLLAYGEWGGDTKEAVLSAIPDVAQTEIKVLRADAMGGDCQGELGAPFGQQQEGQG